MNVRPLARDQHDRKKSPALDRGFLFCGLGLVVTRSGRGSAEPSASRTSSAGGAHDPNAAHTRAMAASMSRTTSTSCRRSTRQPRTDASTHGRPRPRNAKSSTAPKCRSMAVPFGATPKRPKLPFAHGFRGLPGRREKTLAEFVAVDPECVRRRAAARYRGVGVTPPLREQSLRVGPGRRLVGRI